MYWYPEQKYLGHGFTFYYIAQDHGTATIYNDKLFYSTATDPLGGSAYPVLNPLNTVGNEDTYFRYNWDGSVTMRGYFPQPNNATSIDYYWNGAWRPFGYLNVDPNQNWYATLTTKVPQQWSNPTGNDWGGAIPIEAVTGGATYHLLDQYTAVPPQQMQYYRYSYDFYVRPIKLPTSASIEDIGDDKIKIKWTVEAEPEKHPQAGNVHLHKYFDDGSGISDHAQVDYSTGATGFTYTIPSSYIGSGTKIFQFALRRDPFGGATFEKLIAIQKNMNYRIAKIIGVSPNGSNSLNVEWDNDDGYYRSNYKYKVKVTDRTNPGIFHISDNINITEKSATINVPQNTFSTCDPSYVQILMFDDMNVERSASERKEVAFSDIKYKITSLNVSKGYYNDRVDINWTVDAVNNFARYRILRQKYGSNSSPADVAVVDHRSGITSYRYEDKTVTPGEQYTYRVEGDKTCGSNNDYALASFLTDEGYIQPYGVVSGRVTYSGGTVAVEGVTIQAEGTSSVKNKALDFTSGNGTYVATPVRNDMLDSTQFSFQAWVKFHDAEPEQQQLIEAKNRYFIALESGGELTFGYWDGITFQRAYSGITVPGMAYQHVTVTFRTTGTESDVLFYLDGENPVSVHMTGVPSFTAESDTLFVGRSGITGQWQLNGYMDEVRVWTKALTPDEIALNYNAYLSGQEERLSLYYRFDEADALGRVFDISGRNDVFNENHGRINGAVHRSSDDQDTPSASQLSIKTKTDATGYYLINTIPYSSNGNTYLIRPTLGVHKFEPSYTQLYFSANSTTHNNVNFNDASSFNVSGKVVYEGGNYPVEGCSFVIDGKTHVKSDGSPVTSDAEGEFTISVPIGIHEVRIVKAGHTFADDGLLTDNGANINYFQEISDITFHDRTRVRLVGRVVGGKREHAKPLGFGESINNLGVQTVRLTVMPENRFKLIDTDETPGGEYRETPHTGGGYGNWKRDGARLTQDSTKSTVTDYEAVISISPESGEFMVDLPPVTYRIENISTLLGGQSEDVIYSDNMTLDLTNAPVEKREMLKTSVRKWVDSAMVTTGLRPGEMPYMNKEEKTDTVYYNAEWTYYYQGVPTFGFTQVNGSQPSGYLGDRQYVTKNIISGESDTIQLVRETAPGVFDYPFGLPVFVQGTNYTYGLEAFERYVNYRRETSDPLYEDLMPVATGTVYVTNPLTLPADGEEDSGIELDSLGQGRYAFTAGAPDLTTGRGTLEAFLVIDNRSYLWDLTADGTQEAFLLGSKSTGNDFMTAGPDQVDFVVHDPPGSNSYAFFESGTTVRRAETVQVTEALRADIGMKANTAPAVVTWTGIGGGVIVTNKTVMEASNNVTKEQTFNGGTTSESTTTYTERVETSGDRAFVGHSYDVFVGNSSNILYGLVNSITIVPHSQLKGNDEVIHDPTPLAGADRMVLAKTTGFASGSVFDTRFVFTGYEIENIMLPTWKSNLRNILLPPGYPVDPQSITSPVYVSKWDYDHPNFGRLNTDTAAFGAAVTQSTDGPSYKVVAPTGYNFALGTRTIGGQTYTYTFVDSVAWYIYNIKQWEARLADNEKEKVEMVSSSGKNDPAFESNYSFGAGSPVTRTYSISSSKGYAIDWSLSLSDVFSAALGFEISGVSLKVTERAEVALGTRGTETGSTENSTTAGFVLSENNQTDHLTVDWGRTGKDSDGSVAFKLRGGRTSCPYEGEVRTKYYQPGMHILDEGTMRVEAPVLSVSGNANVARVPENKPASYILELKNESETGDDGVFQLVVDEQTNPHGAIIEMDGLPIGNGRTFTVPSGVGKMVSKTLTIRKGPVEDTYDSIAVVLQSSCEPSLSSRVWLRAEFLPSSSDVAFKYPSDKWLLNLETSDTLEIVLDSYNVNHANFSFIELQYRSTASAQWSSIRRFYAEQSRYDASPVDENGRTLLGNSDTEVSYKWATGLSVPDGAYELRARTVCETTQGTFVSEYISETLGGTKDMSAPAVLGRPMPADGILDTGDELSILFNENIQTGLLSKNNFTISGVLNARAIENPNTGVAFDGQQNVAFTEAPINASGSFTVSAWFKRTTPGGAGTLFTYGANGNYVSLGFDAEHHAVVTVGDKTYVSGGTITDDDTWKFVGLVYDRDRGTVSVYEYEDVNTKVLLNGQSVSNAPNVELQGKLYVGNSVAGNSGFNGVLAQLHFYTEALAETAVSADMHRAKSGIEPYLAGYWPMEEGEGVLATDKARSRHLTLRTGWYVYPEGRAVTLNGTGDYVSVNSETFPFTPYNDFTLEFWFKGAAADNDGMTLFTCDTVSIDIDGGKLVLNAGVYSQILTPTSVLNGEWRHFALSCKRYGMTTAFIDGVATAQFTSDFVGKFAGAAYTFGAKETVTGITYSYSDYFKGGIDEIRVWESALTGEIINLNRKSKLYGTEAGLRAYYPFEEYNRQSNGIISVISTQDDMVSTQDNIPTNDLTAASPTPGVGAPAMKDVRPVENVQFDYTASDNKIVFDLKDDLSRIEGTTLEISVKDVRDLRGNKGETEKWIAYVNLNSLKWETDKVNLVIAESEYPTFTARIVNRSGLRADYLIGNLPSWLTLNDSQGSLSPLSYKDLTFQVRKNVNLGSYETALTLSGSVNGVNELLPVTLKVVGERPDWSVNADAYDLSMTVTGQIRLEGAPQTDEDDLVAAFIGDLCVGVGSPQFEAGLNGYLLYLTVYGNTPQKNQGVTFKFWDAGTGDIYPLVEYDNGGVTTLVFKDGGINGAPDNPAILNARNVIEQSIAIVEGTNWISFNVTNANPSLLNQVKENSAGYATAISEKSRNIVRVGSSWIGSLTSILPDQGYTLMSNSAATLKALGSPVNPQSVSITLNKDWNWIGYTPQFILSVEEALAGIPNPASGDMIKSRKAGYRQWSVQSNRWLGNLDRMEPGSGYRYNSESSQAVTFTYPNVSVQMRSAMIEPRNAEAVDKPHWSGNVDGYAENMTVTASVMLDDIELTAGRYEIAAFSGNEYRGSTMMESLEGLTHPFLGFLTVFGENSDPIRFLVYDHAAGKQYDVSEKLSFRADAIHGNPDEPSVLSAVTTPTGSRSIQGEVIFLYPNPVETRLYLRHNLGTLERVAISDISGRTLRLIDNLGDESIDVSDLPAGTYLLRVIHGGEQCVYKFMKK